MSLSSARRSLSAIRYAAPLMTVSQPSVVFLSVLLVCCTRSIERTAPAPFYPVHGAVVDSIHARPLRHARVGVARRRSQTCRIRPDQRIPVDSVGSFTLLLPAGRYRICAEAIGFIARGAVVVLPADSARTLRLSLPWQIIKLEETRLPGLPNKRLKLAGPAFR